MAKKFYAVQHGKVPGVYRTWEECKAQVHGYSGAVYKSFPTAEEAMNYVTGQEVMEDPIDLSERNIGGNDSQRQQEVAVRQNGIGIEGPDCQTIQNQAGNDRRLSDPELASMHNVAGEIKGAEAAMRYAVEHGYSQITIYHDYEGIARWCTGDWRANKSGTQAYKAYYDSISDRLQVRFEKVKGHSGDKYNDMADRLAKQALGL